MKTFYKIQKYILFSLFCIIIRGTIVFAWDNSNYLDDNFRSTNPSDAEIITALYGGGSGSSNTSIYTQYWQTNNCVTGDMTVVKLSPGTDSIPNTLSENTIYVLQSGTYIQSYGTYINTCSSLIGQGKVTLYTTDYEQYSLRYMDNIGNSIIENINLDGTYNGETSHQANQYGIYLYSSQEIHNNSINNINISKFYDGIFLTNTLSSYNILTNITSHSNSYYGIYIKGDHNILHNIQSYNNNNDGITIGGNYTTINNIVSYNNLNGLYLYKVYTGFVNNIILMNNSSIGLKTSYTDTKLHNIYITNNMYGLYNYSYSNNYYYDNLKIFNNDTNINGVGTYTGSANDTGITNLGRGDGVLEYTFSGTTCDWTIRPDRLYFENCSFRGRSTLYTGYSNDYIYGSYIPKQTQVIVYTSTGANYSSLPYDTNSYIKQGNVYQGFGYINIKRHTPSTNVSGVNIVLYSTINNANYTLSGDFVQSPLTGQLTNKESKITISLTSGYDTKNITVYFSSGALNIPEYQTHIKLIDFTGDNLIEQYFGYNSKYIQQWSMNECDISQMQVVQLSGFINSIPTTLSGNTIYLLQSGTYTVSNTINTSKCSAIISTGNTNIISSEYITPILRIDNPYFVIDNITIEGTQDIINGSHNPDGGIYIYYTDNVSIYNTTTKNVYYGILLNNSRYVTLNNLTLYNSSNDNLIVNNTDYSHFNNIRIFNNYYHGINIDTSKYNIFNNIIVFNSNYGIYTEDAQNNIFNNIITYNNYYGIYTRNTTYNIYYNIYTYNNQYNFYNYSIGDTYYGSITSLGTNSVNGNSLITGDLNLPLIQNLGRTIKNEVSIQEDMSCERSILPEYLFPGNDCTILKYIKTFQGITTNAYMYGNKLSTQQQPIQSDSYYDIYTDYTTGFSLSYSSTLEYNDNLPIGGKDQNYSGFASIKFLRDTPSIEQTNTSLQIHSTLTGISYIISGDFNESPISGYLDVNFKTIDVTLTSGYSTKKAYIHFYSGDIIMHDYSTQIEYINFTGNQLVLDYFGYNSPFIQHWSYNSCDITKISIEYITGGNLNTIPVTLTDNTIYILQPGTHLVSSTRKLGNCTAIIGSGDVNIFTPSQMSYEIFQIPEVSNAIVYNLNIDGIYDGDGDTHTQNNYAIKTYSYPNNVTIKDIQTSNIGLEMTAGNFFYIDNIINYNGRIEIRTNNTIANRITSFNSYIQLGGHNTTLNNSVVFNSPYYGIQVYQGSETVINNTIVYNNEQDGIYLYQTNNSILNNISIYNNSVNTSYFGIKLVDSDNNYYYGKLKFFDNYGDNISGPGIYTGTDTYLLSLGFRAGFVNNTDEDMGCQRSIHPDQLFPGLDCSTKHDIIYNNILGFNLKFGDNIPLQQNALGYNSYFDKIHKTEFEDSHILYEDNNNIYTNNYLGWSGTHYDFFGDIQFLRNTKKIAIKQTDIELFNMATGANYIVTGDFLESPLSGSLGNSQSIQIPITLTDGFGTKYVYVSFSSGNAKIPSYSKSIDYINFTGDQIILDYFGYNSPFVQNRQSNNCDITQMSVVYLSGNGEYLPNLSANTIYILSGSFMAYNDYLQSCLALIGNNDKTTISLPSSTLSYRYMFIWTYSIQNIIFNSLTINGNNISNFTSYTYMGDNITLDSLKFNNIAINISNNYSLYNNIINIHKTLQLYGDNNVINNITSYNSDSRYYSVYIKGDQNSISNIQTFNGDGNGIELIVTNSILDNIIAYNNKVDSNDGGIYLRSSYNNILHNLYSYNNGDSDTDAGLYISSDSYNNKYYGTIKLFNNSGPDIIGITGLIQGFTSDPEIQGLARTTGIIDTGAETMSCDRVMNPDFLYPNNDCSIIGYIDTYKGSFDYIYGSKLPKQIKPYRYNLYFDYYHTVPYPWTAFLDYNQKLDLNGEPITYTNHYDLFGRIDTPMSTVISTGINIQLFTFIPTSHFVLSGDFVGSPISGNISDYTSIQKIFLTDSLGTKNIEVQYSSGDKISPIYSLQINYTGFTGDPIVEKYFGSNSEYTINWINNDCDPSAISTVYITGYYTGDDLDQIPSSLSENTIYILGSGKHIVSNQIKMAHCSAIVGSGNAYLYSKGSSSYYPIIYFYSYINNSIIDNIILDGTDDGLGGTHNITACIGDYDYSYSYVRQNHTIYNTHTFNCSYGVYIGFDNSNININNIHSYNNSTYGVYIRSDNVMINNITTFNNSYGVYLQGKGISANNILTFNNDNRGIHSNTLIDSTISNVVSFNNTDYGLSFILRPTNLKLNNIYAYNNGYGYYGRNGLYFSDDATGITLYGDIYLFDNLYNLSGAYNTGYASDPIAIKLGFNDLNLIVNQDSMSNLWLVNPQNTSGDFLLDPYADRVSRIGQKTWNAYDNNIKYSFGDLLVNQLKPNTYFNFYDKYTDELYTWLNAIMPNNQLSYNPSLPIGFVSFDIDRYLKGNGYYSGADGTFSGANPIGLRRTNGQIQKHMIIASDVTQPDISIDIPQNTIVKTANGNTYTGILDKPTSVDTGIASMLDSTSAVFKFGSDDQSLFFKDVNNNPVQLDVMFCSGVLNTGQIYGIYYSNDDGATFNLIGNYTAFASNRDVCISFPTDHATHFAIAGLGGEFTYDIYISGHKNDDRQNVVLNKNDVYQLIIEYNNGSSQVFNPDDNINRYFGKVKKNDIQVGEAATYILNIKPQKSFEPFFVVQ